ncbi:MAG TPA: hypothetical protein VLV18_11015 [Terriglobales bacterium]|nr:hypothetical protein [Terriglobales bacterium]
MGKFLSLTILTILLIAVVAVWGNAIVWAQSNSSTSTVNLSYFTVTMTYPAQVMPGDSATVNLQATAKNSLSSATVSAKILYANGSNASQLMTASVSSSGAVNSGTVLNKQIQFMIPVNAPRTSIFALVSESVQNVNSYYSYGYGYYSPYTDYSDCYYSPSWYYYGYCSYYGNYYSYPYSSTYSTTSTDSGIAPLSYIKAQTPEYTALQSQYQVAEQQLNQSQAQNQQLQQQISQQSATISSMNQQMSSTQDSITTLEAVSVGLAILAIALGAFAVHNKNTEPKPTTKTIETEPK